MLKNLQKLNPVEFWNRTRSNPVILKEMRSRMRGWKAMVGLTAFLLLIGGTVSLIYFGFSQPGIAYQGVNTRKSIGQSIFYTIYIIQLFIIVLTSPGLTAGAIASEREQQTYDLLRTTLLSARDLVTGKLIAAVSFVLLLFLASVPLQSIGLIFGGVSFGELFLGFIILVLTALNFGAVGLFFSSLSKRSRVATVLSQVTTMTFSIALPILSLTGFAIIESFSNAGGFSIPDELALVLGWLVAITSPFATAIVTEVFLIDQQTYFLYQIPLNGSPTSFPAPWIGFAILYPLLTLGLLAAATHFVKKPESQ